MLILDYLRDPSSLMQAWLSQQRQKPCTSCKALGMWAILEYWRDPGLGALVPIPKAKTHCVRFVALLFPCSPEPVVPLARKQQSHTAYGFRYVGDTGVLV